MKKSVLIAIIGKTGGNWDSAPEVTGTLFDDVAKLMIFSKTVAF